jgi:hypothetical protein
MGRYRIVVVSALVLCLAAFGAIAAITSMGGDDTSNAAALPTACENFVDAAELMAEHGSAAVVQLSGGDPLSPDAAERGAETLRRLLDACDAERAPMPR